MIVYNMYHLILFNEFIVHAISVHAISIHTLPFQPHQIEGDLMQYHPTMGIYQ